MALHPSFQPASPQLPIPTPLHLEWHNRKSVSTGIFDSVSTPKRYCFHLSKWRSPCKRWNCLVGMLKRTSNQPQRLISTATKAHPARAANATTPTKDNHMAGLFLGQSGTPFKGYHSQSGVGCKTSNIPERVWETPEAGRGSFSSEFNGWGKWFLRQHWGHQNLQHSCILTYTELLFHSLPCQVHRANSCKLPRCKIQSIMV